MSNVDISAELSHADDEEGASQDETSSLLSSRPRTAEIGCCASIYDPRQSVYRYISLVFICLLTFGPYFCYVSTSALESQFERDLGISTTQYALFNSLYSWPNIVLCFFGGILIDRVFGIRFGTILFSAIVSVGHILFGYGAYVNSLWTMYLGRFIFGMGGETVSVAQKAYCVKWFPPQELNLVFGLIASISLLGCSLNQLAMSPIYNYFQQYFEGHECLGVTLLSAAILALVSTLSAVIMLPLENRRKRILRSQSSQLVKPAKITFTDILAFPNQIYLITLICVTIYSATIPFTMLGKLYVIKKYEASEMSASVQQSLFFMTTVITSPLFGVIVDQTGYNMAWVIFGITLATTAHSMFILTFMNSFLPVLLLGMSLSILYASLWPMVSFVVPIHHLGTAFGLIQSFQNLGLAIFNVYAGYLLENNGYLVVELFFFIMSILALTSSVCLLFYDQIYGNGRLNSPKSQ